MFVKNQYKIVPTAILDIAVYNVFDSGDQLLW